MTKVSVVIPTYNRASVLGRALSSATGQTHSNLEIIVVDDASQDDVTSVIARCGDARVSSVRHPQRRGACAARNTGLEQAQGSFVAFLDSDDEWLPKKIETQLRAFDRSGSNVGVCCSDWLAESLTAGHFDRRPYRRFDPTSPTFREDMFAYSSVLTSALGIRTELLRRVGGFDPRMPRLQDWELCLRLVDQCEFISVDMPLVIKHASTDQITDDLAALATARRLILENHNVFILAHPDLAAEHYFELGSKLCQLGDSVAGRAHLRQAWQTRPWEGKYIAGLLGSYLGANAYGALIQLRQRRLAQRRKQQSTELQTLAEIRMGQAENSGGTV